MSMRDQTGNYLAVLKVIGVGGGGTNAVNRMVEAGLTGVRVHRRQHRRAGAADERRRREDPYRLEGRRAASAPAPTPRSGAPPRRRSRDELKDALKGADMIFVTAGEGGGTGTGAAPTVAELGQELGALTVGVVTKPFAFEGRVRSERAESGSTSSASTSTR